MLVLTRKIQDQIRIGDTITVTILRIKGNTIRLGIEAPRDVRVVRGELPNFDDGEPQSECSQAADVAAEDAANEEPEESPLAAICKSGKQKVRMQAAAGLSASA